MCYHLASLFGTLREEHILTEWGPGIERRYTLGPLTVVCDRVVLYNGCLLHFKFVGNHKTLTPGWAPGYNRDHGQK